LATTAPENTLLAEDLERLADSGFAYDVLDGGDEIGVVVRQVPLPAGLWSQPATEVLLKTTVLYPQSAMDMFWTPPELRLSNGADPQASNLEVHFGDTWRRFSWHRNSEWIPGRDDLLTHLEFALARLNDGR
jgi:hypothetical protein